LNDLPTTSYRPSASNSSIWGRAPRGGEKVYYGKKFEAWIVRSDVPGPLYDTTLGNIAHPTAKRVFTSEGKWRP